MKCLKIFNKNYPHYCNVSIKYIFFHKQKFVLIFVPRSLRILFVYICGSKFLCTYIEKFV